MSDSSKMIEKKDQEKFRLRKRIIRIITIFLILQLLEFFILEAPNSFRELSESENYIKSSNYFFNIPCGFYKINQKFYFTLFYLYYNYECLIFTS